MMKMILNGYGGYATIDGYEILMTSFSLSMNERIIESNGVANYLYPQTGEEEAKRFKRYRFNALRDYPEYQISISCEITYDLYCHIMDVLAINFDNKMPVYFSNSSTGLYYHFDDCYLMSFNMEIGNNTVASASFTFMSYMDTIDVEYQNMNFMAGRLASEKLIGTPLMPYWAFGVSYVNNKYPTSIVKFDSTNLYDFSFSYERTITPKHGCFGKSSNNALAPFRIVIGIPTVSIDMTYLVGNYTSLHPYRVPSNQIVTSDYVLTLMYKKIREEATQFDEQGNVIENTGEEESVDVKFMRCYLTSYALSAGDGSTVDKIRMSGSCYGEIIKVTNLSTDESTDESGEPSNE
jgi:hypothetical protein